VPGVTLFAIGLASVVPLVNVLCVVVLSRYQPVDFPILDCRYEEADKHS
jgi:hypothetical protein